MSTKVKGDKIKEGSIPLSALAPLNDTDKNQVLANLGIDPVVWKYLCNPYIIRVGVQLTDEIKNIIISSYGQLKNIIFNVCLAEADDESYHKIKTIHSDYCSISTYDTSSLIYNSDTNTFEKI